MKLRNIIEVVFVSGVERCLNVEPLCAVLVLKKTLINIGVFFQDVEHTARLRVVVDVNIGREAKAVVGVSNSTDVSV